MGITVKEKSMRELVILFVCFASVVLVLPVFLHAQSNESIVITTYYPSPYGSYRDLSSYQVRVGSNPTYSNASELLNNFQNGMIVEGNVGIGMVNPGFKLDVDGDIHATGNICSDLDGGKCLSSAGAVLFGGMYELFYCDSTCRLPNPVTGACSCPAGFIAAHASDMNFPLDAPCGSQMFYQAKGMIQYFCYK